MPVHLMREVEHLKKLILSLAAEVEENLRLAVKSVIQRDPKMAQLAIETDHTIDEHEVMVEEECLKILALHQPVAHDLRFIVAILKINHDLERVGDLAVNIAERAQVLAQHAPVHRDFALQRLADKAQSAVSRSLDALINRDLKLAREIWLTDDEADDFNRDLLNQVEEEIKMHPEQLPSLLALTSVSRTLERVADHATNISKDVIYLIEGDIVRHRSRQYRERLEQNGETPRPG
jgi:phosphate transport system protein